MPEHTPLLHVADLRRDALHVELPRVEPGLLDQDQEWCLVRWQGVAERVRFHDYARIYRIPGLYEELFYRRLACTSPETVSGLLTEALAAAGERPADLRVLDLGAGNGMVGEALRRAGVAAVVGIDVVHEARAACLRDRPGVYDDYVVTDMTALPSAARGRLERQAPNAMTTVAALGFGDIPVGAFATAWNLIETPGWVAFNIKEAFLDEKYQYGFSLLVRRLLESGLLAVGARHRYLHRRAVSGEPLHYIAIVGRKTGPIPDEWLTDAGG